MTKKCFQCGREHTGTFSCPPPEPVTKTMSHVEELRQVASLDQCAWDYAQKLMRSSAEEIAKLDADAAGVQAELESMKLERHQLRNELTAARLDNERLRCKLLEIRMAWRWEENAKIGQLIADALDGDTHEPGADHLRELRENLTARFEHAVVDGLKSAPEPNATMRCVWRSGCQDVPRCTEAGKCLQISRKGTRRPTGQCSWGCYYSDDGRLVRDSACTVHGGSSVKSGVAVESGPDDPPTRY